MVPETTGFVSSGITMMRLARMISSLSRVPITITLSEMAREANLMIDPFLVIVVFSLVEIWRMEASFVFMVMFPEFIDWIRPTKPTRVCWLILSLRVDSVALRFSLTRVLIFSWMSWVCEGVTMASVGVAEGVATVVAAKTWMEWDLAVGTRHLRPAGRQVACLAMTELSWWG